MDLLLKNKIALVTGASKGLGAAISIELAKEGVDLILVSRNIKALSSLGENISSKYGVKTLAHSADMTSNQDCLQAVNVGLKKFGKIDILVNSAGASQGGLFWDLPDSIWQDSFELKIMGTIRMIRAVIPDMIKKEYGRIVNIVGNTGMQPSPRLLPGASANAALLAITKGLGEELASHKITINALNPGPTRTERWINVMDKLAKDSKRTIQEVEKDYIDQIPMQRLANPDEIARLAILLASDTVANMTGACLTADGGWTKGIG